MINATLPCLACRTGRCAAHGVTRFVPHPGRALEDEVLVEFCCAEFEDAFLSQRRGVSWKFCPWCSRAIRGAL